MLYLLLLLYKQVQMMILPHTHTQKEEEGKCKSGAWTTLKPYINILKSKNWNEQENWYEWWYV